MKTLHACNVCGVVKLMKLDEERSTWDRSDVCTILYHAEGTPYASETCNGIYEPMDFGVTASVGGR